VWITGLAGLSDVALQSGDRAGLRVWPGKDRECLWIPGLAGLKGSSGRDREGLRGGSLG
jgi:hypothetical protein